MARIWSSGFELNSLTAEQFGTTFTAPTLVTSPVRSGTYALSSIPSSSRGSAATFQFSSFPDISGLVYYRYYLYISSLPSATVYTSLVENSSSTNFFGISITTSGQLQMLGLGTQIGSNSSTLSTNTWYRVELSLDTTSSTVTATALLNGIQFATGSFSTAVKQGLLQIGIQSTNASNVTGTFYYDDIAINDSTGSFQNSYPGDGSIVHLRPNAAGDVNTFSVGVGGTAGQANNFSRVNEVTPDSLSTYNKSNILNQEDLYNIDDTPVGIGSSDTINVIQVGVFYRGESTTLTPTFKVEFEKAASGTISQGTAITPNSTTFSINANAAPKNYPLTLYQNPDSTTITKATLDTSQIGVKITTGNTVSADISTLWLLVESTPGVATSTFSGWKTLLGVGQICILFMLKMLSII